MLLILLLIRILILILIVILLVPEPVVHFINIVTRHIYQGAHVNRRVHAARNGLSNGWKCCQRVELCWGNFSISNGSHGRAEAVGGTLEPRQRRTSIVVSSGPSNGHACID